MGSWLWLSFLPIELADVAHGNWLPIGTWPQVSLYDHRVGWVARNLKDYPVPATLALLSK